MHLTEELENCKVRGLVTRLELTIRVNNVKISVDSTLILTKMKDEAITHLSLVGTMLAIEAVTTSRSPQLS